MQRVLLLRGKWACTWQSNFTNGGPDRHMLVVIGYDKMRVSLLRTILVHVLAKGIGIRIRCCIMLFVTTAWDTRADPGAHLRM